MRSVLVPMLFLLQAAAPTADPAVALERARIAEATGEWAKAEAFLREASSAKDPAVAGEAKQRLAALLVRLGQERDPASRPVSPTERRVAEALERLDKGITPPDDVKKEIVWIGEAALPAVAAWVEDPTKPALVRDMLLSAAAQIGGEGALALLERIASSKDDLLRRKAIEVFGGPRGVRVPEERWIAVVSRFLDDPDAGARRAALNDLADHPEVLRPKASALARDPDPGVRSALARLRLPPDVILEQARDGLLRDPVASVRQAVAEKIGRGEWPEPASAALVLFGDSDEAVRSIAVQAIRRSPPNPSERPALIKGLLRLVSDPSVRVRATLANVAVEAAGDGAIPILLALVLDPVEQVCANAVSGLRGIRNSDYRREDLPAVCNTMIEVARRFQLSSGISGVVRMNTTADQYLTFFHPFISKTAAREDFPHAARVFAEVRGLAEANPSAAKALLDPARSEDLGLLCNLWKDVREQVAREILCAVLGEKAAPLPRREQECAIEVLRQALRPESEVRSSAVRAAIRVGAPELGAGIAQALAEAPIAEGTWGEITLELDAMHDKAPKETVASLVALATRPSSYPAGASGRSRR